MIGKKMQELRKAKKMSTTDVADAIGIKPRTYLSYETEEREPNLSVINAIADYYDVTVDYLLGRECNPKRLNQRDEELEKNLLEVYRSLPENVRKDILNGIKDTVLSMYSAQPQCISIQYIDAAASAGLGELLSDYEDAETVLVPLTPESRKADFVLRVHGDSMEPMYSDGDHVLVKQQDAIDVGEIGIFAQGGEGYIKELGEGVLIPLNKKYPEIPLDDSSRCFGIVLGKTELI
jgi:phage repressor protein C with HTH and peptisase S24 domain